MTLKRRAEQSADIFARFLRYFFLSCKNLTITYSYLVGGCSISDLFGKGEKTSGEGEAEPNIGSPLQVNQISGKQLTNQLFYYSCPES